MMSAISTSNIKTASRLRGGYSLVEILVIVGISVLLGSISFYALTNQDNRELLDKTTLSAVALLEQARGSTLASKNALQYGVHFDTNQMVLFSGTTYSSGNSGNSVVAFDRRITASTIALAGGGHDVIFDRLTGTTAKSGTIRLSLTASSSIYKVITIYATGLVERN